MHRYVYLTRLHDFRRRWRKQGKLVCHGRGREMRGQRTVHLLLLLLSSVKLQIMRTQNVRSSWLKLKVTLRYFSVLLLLLLLLLRRFRRTVGGTHRSRRRRSIAHTNELSHVITYGLNLNLFRIRLLNSRRRKLSVTRLRRRRRRILLLTMPVLVLIQITCQELSCHDTILCIRDLRVDGVAVGKHLCGGSCVRVRTSFSRRDRE